LAAGVGRHLNYRRGSSNLAIWAALIGGKFDLCLDFTGTDRSALMAKLSGANRKVGYQKVADKKPSRAKLYQTLCGASVRELHTLDYHHALLEAAGIDAQPAGTSIDIPEDAAARVAELCPAGEFAVVHAGTAREEKYWPAERWAEIIDGLGMPVVLTGADDPFERAHLDAIEAGTKAEVTDLAGRLTLVETAAVIARCGFALGVDTAAMHLASGLEKPQVVLYGPTNPFHWRPRHSRAAIALAGENEPLKSFTPRHKAASMDELSTAAVVRAIGCVREG
jgi:ADP-heptose:LPS heptosyltransferase